MPTHHCIGNPCIICHPPGLDKVHETYIRKLIQEEIASSQLKRASCVLLRNGEYVLTVSRKDDPNDVGLPGGKCENDEDDQDCARRECEEETGIACKELKFAYAGDDGLGYWVTTYVGDYEGEIDTDEIGVVRWVKPEVLLTHSSFADYNQRVLTALGLL